MTTRGGEQPADVHAVPVEQGDDEDAADVVEDGERRDEYDETMRDTALEQSQAADGECDVCRHRDSPASAPGPSSGERKEDRGGNRHASESSERRQQRAGRSSQLAANQLALDFETDDEEEDRHQDVVDEFSQRQTSWQRSDLDSQGRLEEFVVARRPRPVRPCESSQGHRQQHEPARSLESEELSDWMDHHLEERWQRRSGSAS